MLASFISRFLILALGTFYPAYRSYKALRSKSATEYLCWLRYWVVFACFVVVEAVCDIFISWIPFYHELKIITVLCLLTRSGSTIVYKNIVHPTISCHEAQIDQFLESTRTGGYNAVVNAGSRLLKYGSDMFINTAIKRGLGESLVLAPISHAVTDDLYLRRQQSMPRSASMDNVYHEYYDESEGENGVDTYHKMPISLTNPVTQNIQAHQYENCQIPQVSHPNNGTLSPYGGGRRHRQNQAMYSSLNCHPQYARQASTIGASNYAFMISDAAGAIFRQVSRQYLNFATDSTNLKEDTEIIDKQFADSPHVPLLENEQSNFNEQDPLNQNDLSPFELSQVRTRNRINRRSTYDTYGRDVNHRSYLTSRRIPTSYRNTIMNKMPDTNEESTTINSDAISHSDIISDANHPITNSTVLLADQDNVKISSKNPNTDSNLLEESSSTERQIIMNSKGAMTRNRLKQLLRERDASSACQSECSIDD